ncbi:MAG: DUF4270 domain-containing protein [Alistipes sp.]|nr:DUF4270 domain-containing protein [Alistipes sp.]
MMKSNRFRRILSAAAIVLAGAALATGCTTVDDSLGANLVPDNQQMRAGWTTFPRKGEPNPKKYVETRLFQTDSICSSNISYGYMGSQRDDTIGLRSAGFLTQYLYYTTVSDGIFGQRPIFDSAQLLLSISSYGLDTTTSQLYHIYEITTDPFATDTIFYLDFDPTPYVDTEPLFSFTFPDGTTTGPATTAVTLAHTDKGREFVDRLLLQSGKYAGDYSVYTTADSLAQWFEEFKGLYIRPAADQTDNGKGGIYALDLSGSGLAVYGRTRVEEDPSLVKDTVSLLYIFKDTDFSPTYGNNSINTLARNYAQGSQIDPVSLRKPGTEIRENERLDGRVIVEGMGGIITGITFTQDFFDALEHEIAAANEEGYAFSTLAFSQVCMSIYFADSDYEWEHVMLGNPDRLVGQMNAAPERIGLYTDFMSLKAVSDYDYYNEKVYDLDLSYDGYINRSRGCYMFDITGHVQQLWNGYLAEREEAGREGRDIDIENIAGRTIYAAPEAYGLFTSLYTVLQGMADDAQTNDAPIRFEMTYNLLKK